MTTLIRHPRAACAVGAGMLLSVSCFSPSALEKGTARSAEPPPSAPPPAVEAGPLVRLEPSRIHVEAGEIEPIEGGRFAIRNPCVRAVVPGVSGSTARISFVYRGHTRATARLASGELRRQIGLKLRAQDTCNIIYVMWHIEPTTGTYVQIKRNPGQKTHEECLDHGYRMLEPSQAHPAPPVRIGERHVLEASIEGKVLHVLADGRSVWEGMLPAEAFAFGGPAGIRSDNGEFEVELFAAAPPQPGRAR